MKKNIRYQFTVFGGVFAALCLLHSADRITAMNFATGGVVALAYSGFNLAIACPMSIVAALIFGGEEQFCRAVLSGVILVICYALHAVLKKPISRFRVNLYAFFAQIPFVFFRLDLPLAGTVGAVVVSQAFCYFAICAVYAFAVRKAKFVLTLEEKVSVCVVVYALFCGLFGVRIGEFSPYYAFAALVVSCAVKLYGAQGVVLAVAVGLGGTGGGAQTVATVCVWAVCSLVFADKNRWFSALALVLSDVAFSSLAVFQADYNFLNLLSTLLGATAFCLLPSGVFNSLYMLCALKNDGRESLLRNRSDACEVVEKTAELLFSMKDGVTCADAEGVVNARGDGLKKILAETYCKRCAKRNDCAKSNGGNLEEIFDKIALAALNAKKVTLLDLPPYLTGNCEKIEEISRSVNGVVSSYFHEEEKRRISSEQRRLTAEVLSGAGDVLLALAKRLNVRNDYDVFREKELIDELLHFGVSCRGAIVQTCGDENEVRLLLSADELRANTVKKVVSSVMKRKVEIKSVSKSGDGQLVILRPTSRFDLVVGIASSAKEGNTSGDVFALKELPDGKKMLALSDGMGNGKRANAWSEAALRTVENFFAAGVPQENAFRLTNGLMSLGGGDRFETLDVVLFDGKTGSAESVKSGAAESLFFHDGRLEVLSGESLPIGIIESVSPSKRTVSLEKNDYFVLFSDGLSDALGTDNLVRFVEENGCTNPQVLADGLVELAKRNRATDDVTVIAARVFEREGVTVKGV